MIRRSLELGLALRNARLDPARLRALQNAKLRRVVRHAVREVPYYRELLREIDAGAGDVRTVDDLRRIPITTKDDLRSAGLPGIIARGVDPSRCRRWLTSGSTGEPFAVHQRRREAVRREVLEFRALLGLGLRPADRLAVVGPESAWPRRRCHERLGLYRTRIVPGGLDTEEQLRALARFDPTVLWTYPTSLEALRHHAGRRLGASVRPRLLLWSAEVLDPSLGDRVVDELGVDVFGLYGCFEVGRLAVECPTHRGLHVNADHVVLEILDDDGRPAAPGVPGSVVVTDLDNLTQPFIRYRLGDVCRRIEGDCPCGSSFPLICAPDGREHDVLYLPGGRTVVPFAVSFAVRAFLEVRRFRAVQLARDRVRVDLELESPMADERLSRLRSRLQNVFGTGAQLDLRIVSELPKVVGKTRAVVRAFDRTGDGRQPGGGGHAPPA